MSKFDSWGIFGGSTMTLDDPPMWQQSTWSCNCACQTCMAGGCCMALGRPWRPTVTSTGTGPFLPAHEHDFFPFDAKRLYCRTCGETRVVR